MKTAPILARLESEGHESVLVHTGQHYDDAMSGSFFSELGMRAPDHHLGVGSGTQAEQLGRVMQSFEPVLRAASPDWVVVVGDVTSTLGAALVVAKLRGAIPVRLAHVEAGLRSRDWAMPEEINRVLTDRVSDLLLTPSHDAADNLAAEGIPAEKVVFVGNVMIDTLVARLPAARELNFAARIGVAGQYALVTLHRPSNVDDPRSLEPLLLSLRAIAAKMEVVFPVHPRTRNRISEAGLDHLLEGVHLLEPVSYLEMLSLSAGASIVLTDSGGLQEETTVLGVPCLTLREQTERPITITEGTNQLVEWPPRPESVLRQVVEMTASGSRDPKSPEGWDGKAAERIVAALVSKSGAEQA